MQAGESLAATGILELGRRASKVHRQEARDRRPMEKASTPSPA